jgi:two-component system LytT family response regulator
MDKYTCVIVDDEPQAIELLSDSLRALYPDLEIVETYTKWSPAFEAIRNGHYDLLFLDISIRDKSGLDLVRFTPEIKSEIIFVTAHADYAIEAFRLSAGGYIVKPIDDTDLIRAVNLALDRIKHKKLASTPASSPLHHERIGIPSDNAIDYVNLADIQYLESVNSYTRVVTTEQEFLSSYNIGKFKQLTDNKVFFQAHRSFVVNLNFVKRFEHTGVIIMENNKEIPLSRNHKDEFLSRFSKVQK